MSDQPTPSSPTSSPHFDFSKLPSIVWVLLFILGIVAVIGGTILLFLVLATVEGVASLALLVVAVLVIWGTTSALSGVQTRGDGIGKAIGITFFALMGMAIDQTGNFLYNLPFQYLFCPAGSVFRRGVSVFHPLPERTDIVQAFSCMNSEGVAVYQISSWQIIAVRFVEYLVLGYLLIWIVGLVKKRKKEY